MQEYAQTLQLDLEKYKQDYTLKDIRKSIEQDYSDGVNIGIDATPTFYLNGVKVDNIRNYGDIKRLIDRELAK